MADTTESGKVHIDKTEPGKVHVIDTMDEFKKYVLESKDKLIVVDAFAEWCGPCKFIAPHIATMSEEHQETAFYKFDVDESPDIAQELSIKAMPTFVFFKNGKEVKKVVGGDKKKLEDAVVQLNA